jgi:hypothetical protein
LLTHGVLPEADTPPAIVHDYINGLYLYEIRKTKYEMLAGEFPRSEYTNHILELRNRYPVLSLPLQFWTEDEETEVA